MKHLLAALFALALISPLACAKKTETNTEAVTEPAPAEAPATDAAPTEPAAPAEGTH